MSGLRPGVLALLGLALLTARLVMGLQLDFLEIHYIANEGALMQFRGQQVLVDALFSEGLGNYEAPDAEKARLLQKGAAPFDQVQVVLVTHAHADHFDPLLTRDYLLANRSAQLIAPTQVVEKLREQDGFGEIESRIRGFSLPAGQRRSVVVGDIPVDLLGLPHGGRFRDEVENLGYIVKLGNQKLLHIGDADPEISDFKPLHLPTDGIDIFLAPFWFAVGPDEAAFTREWINPRRVIGIHFEITRPAEIQKQMQAQFPESVMFSNLLGKHIYLATVLD